MAYYFSTAGTCSPYSETSTGEVLQELEKIEKQVTKVKETVKILQHESHVGRKEKSRIRAILRMRTKREKGDMQNIQSIRVLRGDPTMLRVATKGGDAFLQKVEEFLRSPGVFPESTEWLERQELYLCDGTHFCTKDTRTTLMPDKEKCMLPLQE